MIPISSGFLRRFFAARPRSTVESWRATGSRRPDSESGRLPVVRAAGRGPKRRTVESDWIIERDSVSGVWRTARDFQVEIPGGAGVVRVPKGFETDLASVPRLLWPLIGSHELSIVAPVVHDWLYRRRGLYWQVDRKQYLTRADADRLFLRLMILEGVAGWKARAAWLAVRLFALDWRRHPEQNEGDVVR